MSLLLIWGGFEFSVFLSLNSLLLILFLPTVLFSLSIYSFFVFLILVNQLISNKFFFDKIILAVVFPEAKEPVMPTFIIILI